MSQLSDLRVSINGQQIFFLNQRTVSSFSGRLTKLLNQEHKTQIRELGFDDFPGGSNGFELVSRFCYNNGKICISPANVSMLHSCAIFLEMTEQYARCNLLRQTETFLDGIFNWSFNEILISLKQCELFFASADSSGLLQMLITVLLAKISTNSDTNFSSSCSSFFSSPELTRTPDITKPCLIKTWWFNDLTILNPKIVGRVIKSMAVNGTDNLILTRFIFHFLNSAIKSGLGSRTGYSELADAVVNGLVLMGKTAVSCRGLFWILRVVSGLGLSKNCRAQIEKLIGEMLDRASLDDLLVSGHGRICGIYDVNLVLRLVRIFVNGDGVCGKKMKKVGRLMDQYMREISPDPRLKVSKFLSVAESLPDCARDCFDGVYRALDIYLEAHPGLSFEERTRLCKSLNYKKLTLEACKDLAKNKRIPPRIAIQAQVSQQSKLQQASPIKESLASPKVEISEKVILYTKTIENSPEFSDEREKLKVNLQRMQWRVVELENICREMQMQLAKIIEKRGHC